MNDAHPVNPSGICFCGCGKTTPIATRTAKDIRKGEHFRHCQGHKGDRGLLTRTGRSRCTKCEQVKALAEFNFSQQRQQYLIYCKACLVAKNRASFQRNGRRPTPERSEYLRRWYHEKGRARFLERKYGITDEAYTALLEEQCQRCAICLGTDSNMKLSVDHDHQTGAVRGLLCRACNMGVGIFNEDPAALRRAADYLS